jgi:uncharacterized protein (TIGR03083 family)
VINKEQSVTESKTSIQKELQDARDLLLAEVEHLSVSDWTKPAPPEGWTVKDVLTHLAASQPTQPVLIRNILEGKGGSRPDFDLNFFNRRGLEKRQGKSVDELKAELASGHADALKLLDELTDAQLAGKGKHPRGEMTIAEIFHVIALHDCEHTGHIRAALGK